MEPTEPSGRSVLDLPTLVLNRSWIPVHITSVRRAICMVYREVACIVSTDTMQLHDFMQWVRQENLEVTRCIKTARVAIPCPEVIRLNQYDRIPTHEAPFTRRNLYQRDKFTCQYCGRRTTTEKLSIDHVVPRSKGGRTTWENCVLACVRCNARKADRTLKDAGLRLQTPPRRPRWSPYLNMTAAERLPSWRKFTGQRGGDLDGLSHTGSA